MTDTNAEIEIIVRGVAVCDGKLLVCRTGDAEITYLPGGHIDPGEPARVALVREIQEELGLSSTAGRYLGTIEHSFVQKGKQIQEISVFFLAEVDGLDPNQPPQTQEHWLSFEWADVNALDVAQLEPSPLQTLVPKWLQGQGEGWASTMEPNA